MSYIVACDLEPADPGAPGEGLVHVLLVEWAPMTARPVGAATHATTTRRDQPGSADCACWGVPGRVRGPRGPMLCARRTALASQSLSPKKLHVAKKI